MRNSHLSYSRLKRYEQCPLSYKFTYLDGFGGRRSEALIVGTAFHKAAEIVVRDITQANNGPQELSESRVMELFQRELKNGGQVAPKEAASWVQRFCARVGSVDPSRVLAIEGPGDGFSLAIGATRLIGQMDLVLKESCDTIVIVDYKTNKRPYTQLDLLRDRQAALYTVAARQEWPWAKRVKFVFHLIKLDVLQTIEVSEEKQEEAVRWAERLGNETEEATDFPANLTRLCDWCEHSVRCPAYQGKTL